MPEHLETVVPFAPANTTSGNADQLDRAGQTILQLLNKAAGAAEENSRKALDMAQKHSQQLRAAEDRIAELEAATAAYQQQAEGRIAELKAEAAAYQERAERAEQWLHRVYAEIQDRFLRQDQNARRGVPQRR